MRTANSLVSNANTWRKEQVFAILDTLSNGQKPDTTSLAQNASRPIALGYSTEDLIFYRNMYKERSLSYHTDAQRAMAFVAKTNTQISRDGGHASQRQVAERKAACEDASWNAHRARTCTKFVEIVDGILESRKPVAPPPIAVTPITVMQEAPKPLTMKIKHHVKKVAQCRGEITLKGFADLKEFTENTALILSK
jgi:hypothetical protein